MRDNERQHFFMGLINRNTHYSISEVNSPNPNIDQAWIQFDWFTRLNSLFMFLSLFFKSLLLWSSLHLLFRKNVYLYGVSIGLKSHTFVNFHLHFFFPILTYIYKIHMKMTHSLMMKKTEQNQQSTGWKNVLLTFPLMSAWTMITWAAWWTSWISPGNGCPRFGSNQIKSPSDHSIIVSIWLGFQSMWGVLCVFLDRTRWVVCQLDWKSKSLPSHDASLQPTCNEIIKKV